MAFNHEGLNVYQRTLSFNVKVGIWTGEWDSRHAIHDHLSRAAGSMLENIAMASAAHSSMKLRSLDYAIGSSLECAACLDLARIKRLLDAPGVYAEKEELSQILRMLVGLRKSWASSAQVVREGSAEYAHESAINLAARLDVCVTQTLLSQEEVVRWKTLLERVSVMTSSMIASIRG
jgi:four helix bundle protein